MTTNITFKHSSGAKLVVGSDGKVRYTGQSGSLIVKPGHLAGDLVDTLGRLHDLDSGLTQDDKYFMARATADKYLA